MAIDPQRLREIKTADLEARLISMDKNLFFIDDRKMQAKAIETMAVLQTEVFAYQVCVVIVYQDFLGTSCKGLPNQIRK